MAVSVDDIAAMSDTELAQFMEQNRTSDGNFDLPVDDWDKLSKDERNCLAERLQAQQRALAQSPTAHSRSLDLDQIDARLREASSDNNNTSSQGRPFTPQRSRCPTPVFDREDFQKDLEIDAYNELIKDGGRPLYQIDLLDEIFLTPEKHYELLRPWQLGWWTRFPWRDPDGMDEPREIFQRQLARWQDFRKWQNDNRDLENDDEEYMAHANGQIRHYKRNLERTEGHREWCPGTLDEMENDPSYFKDSSWELYQETRDVQRRQCRESRGGKGYAGYVEAVKRRLSHHGFTRPFQLKEDPKQQDKLTEWIEYLNYECFWLDWYAASIERLKPAHDKAWQELVDSKTVKPHETSEVIRTDEFMMKQSRELNHADEVMEKVMLKAKQVYTSTQLDPNRFSIPREERRRRVREVTRELLAASASRDSSKKRIDDVTEFIHSTFRFVSVTKDAPRHSILVQWVLDQVPLVEAELAKSEATKAKPDEPKRGTKRRRDPNDDDSEERTLKKQKLDDGHLARSAAATQALITSRITP